MIKQMGFLLGLILLGGLSFQLTAMWLDHGRSRSTAHTIARAGSIEPMSRRPAAPASVTYCEMQFPADDCPAHPGGFPISRQKQLRDTWEGADKSLERCMRRAQEYHAYCSFQGTVTARFVRDGRVEASRSVP